MRSAAILVVVLGGCNAILGLDPTSLGSDGGTVAPDASPPPALDTGTGADGDLFAIAITYTDDIRAAVTAPISAGDATIAVDTGDAFNAGDEVVVIAMLGDEAGHYETRRIEARTATSLTFEPPLAQAFGGATQVIRVPNYAKVDVPGGALLTAHAWNGATGGVVFFRANDSVTIEAGGALDASGLGLRGGDGGGSVTGSGGGGGGAGGPPDVCPIDCVSETAVAGDGNPGNSGAGPSGSSGASSGQCFAGAGGRGGATGASSSGGHTGSAGEAVAAAPDFARPIAGSGGHGGDSGASGAGGGGGGGAGGTVGASADGGGGGPGGSGGMGAGGGKGGLGGGIIIIDAPSIAVTGILAANGTIGTTGGTGGNGGNGGTAGVPVAVLCHAMSLVGGSGGPGTGAGAGSGGSGGDGGSGGTIVLEADTIALDAAMNAIGGDPGPAGSPGTPGKRGDLAAILGPTGSAGASGATGQLGAIFLGYVDGCAGCDTATTPAANLLQL